MLGDTRSLGEDRSLSSIIWLASYPKSGNTWLRALLTNYLSPGDEPADINSLGAGGGEHAASRALFDELVGVQASALDRSAISRLRPELYRRLASSSQEDVFVKVHDVWTCTDGGEPMFPEDVTRTVVYILRNPLDVAVSWAHHRGVGIEHTVGQMCGGPAPDDRPGHLGGQLPQQIGSWRRHVHSWLDASGLRCHVVRFEDLRADPERAFARVVDACGLPTDPGLVRRAVAFSDFAELRRQELERGFAERSPNARGEFFRRGEVGGWRDDLPVELALRLTECSRDMMSRFGYLDKSNPAEVWLGAQLTVGA
jgi:hypothetical protein